MVTRTIVTLQLLNERLAMAQEQCDQYERDGNAMAVLKATMEVRNIEKLIERWMKLEEEVTQ